MDLKADGVVLKWTAVSLAMLTPFFFSFFFWLVFVFATKCRKILWS